MGRGASGNLGSYRVGNGTRKRRNADEFNKSMASGNYIPAYSSYSNSGGFVLTHNDHNITDKYFPQEIYAARVLADYGYRVYLDNEKSFIDKQATPDGRLNVRVMEIKTITESNKNTIRRNLDRASSQDAEVVVLVEHTRGFSDSYIRQQVNLYKKVRHPKSKISEVFYVRKDGSVRSIKI